MKVLLISHPRKNFQKPDFPPIGIAYLGAVSRRAGHETRLIDGGLKRIPDIIKEAKSFSPDLIGLTCWTLERETIWALCRSLKEELPGAFLVVGGPHATFYPGHIFKLTHASAVVIGEGEETFRELLAALSKGEDPLKVKGMFIRSPGGGAVFSGPREPVENLDLIEKPFYPGFKSFSFKNYCGFPSLPRPTAPIISSRGCVFDCTYCGSVKFWGNRWRYRSADNIIDEMGWLIGKMGAKSVFFFDDNFLVNKDRVIDLCEKIIKKEWKIKWSCCSHVKMINDDVLKMMKKSGCVSIDFGVESGSDMILKNINKKQTRLDIEKAFALVHKNGIKPRAYLMVGNKGENEATIDETIDMIGNIRPWSSIGGSLVFLLPGTAIYNEAVLNGFIKDDYWIESDKIPYNLQERSYQELVALRQRLMLGMLKKKRNFAAVVNYYLKLVYYKYSWLEFLRPLIPDMFR
jgi:anaerobic magnesium-protoporphyrin IX monomethyl ester cyclase